MKVFYLHVPKTAGSSINVFFSKHLNKALFHIESLAELKKEELENYDFVSGHIPLNKIDKVLDLEMWDTVASFREPISYVASHIKWIRKLADPDQQSRFDSHPKIFQTVALKMASLDFANPYDIHILIDWLETLGFYYLHNTQSIYLNSSIQSKNPSEAKISEALKNLHRIDMVCIQENLDDFFNLVSLKYGWELLKESPRVNTNRENYGLDISNPMTVEALERLVLIDKKVYSEACAVSKSQLQSFSLDQKKRKLSSTNHSQVVTESIRGVIDNVAQDKVSGWVAEINSDSSLVVELYVNGEYKNSSLANIMRVGVVRNGYHLTGYCGFSFMLDSNLSKGSIVEIKIKDRELTLTKEYD